MRTVILNKLAEIEKTHDVKILLAAETGSRAWGFSSTDSDYDVRFIYVHKLPWYLHVATRRDVFEYMSDDRLLDFVGWDIRKAMRLFIDSNLTMLEWVHSPLLYSFDNEFLSQVKELEQNYFQVKNGIHHYHSLTTSIAKRSVIGQHCKMKPFLYFLRGLLACRWIERFRSAPPVPFMELVDAMVDDTDIKRGIIRYIEMKSRSKEHDRTAVEPQLFDYAIRLAEYYNNNMQQLTEAGNVSADSGPVDNLVVDMILKYSPK